MNTQFGGLIGKLALLGSADGKKFLTHSPGEAGVEGNYEIEHTPQEVARVIAVARSHEAPVRRVLSLGSRTLGAERAIVEHVGATSLDWVAKDWAALSPAHALNVQALGEEGVAVKARLVPEYDMVLVAGNDRLDYERVLEAVRVGGLVVTLGSGLEMGWPNLRALFLRFRNAGHRTIAQTGAVRGEMGVGVVMVTHKPPAVAQPDPAGQEEEARDVAPPKVGAPAAPRKASSPKKGGKKRSGA